MKLVTFQLRTEQDASPRLGVSLDQPAGGEIIALQTAAVAKQGEPLECLASMLDWLDAGPAARETTEAMVEFAMGQRPAGSILPIGSCRLLAPLPRPRSIRDCMAFEQHVIAATRTVVAWRVPWAARLDRWWQQRRGRSFLAPPRVWYERPIYYKGNPHSVVGPDAEIAWPAFTEKLDYELEFGVVIGRPGRDIRAAEAASHVAGYMIFNDFSARDVQLHEMQGRLGPAKSKDFDTGNALGPYLVTRDEVPDPQSLRMTARVNGQIWSSGSSAEMYHPFDAIIAYISQDETLVPGDFIGSGTVPGGCGLELDRWLQPGDVVELEVESLGTLRNRISNRQPAR